MSQPTSRAPVLAYPLGDALYLNLTSACTLACTFCPKIRDDYWVVGGFDLKLTRPPTVDDVWSDATALDIAGRAEVVFTGLGEPTRRLDAVLDLTRRLKAVGVRRVRLDTDGLANLREGRDVVPELACAGLDAQARGTEAVRLLESAGYAWEARPAWDGAPVPGSGLRRAGRELPPMTILVADDDPLRIASASAIAEQLKFLGLDASVERAAPADVLYRVFETHQYDMVVLGWRLARYPGYLCDLFGSGNPYAYANADLEQHCAFFRAATDLELARQEVFAIQSILAANLPAVPLYSESVFDAMRGVTYPFDATLDGVTGLYGAPWLAIPAP